MDQLVARREGTSPTRRPVDGRRARRAGVTHLFGLLGLVPIGSQEVAVDAHPVHLASFQDALSPDDGDVVLLHARGDARAAAGAALHVDRHAPARLRLRILTVVRALGRPGLGRAIDVASSGMEKVARGRGDHASGGRQQAPVGVTRKLSLEALRGSSSQYSEAGTVVRSPH